MKNTHHITVQTRQPRKVMSSLSLRVCKPENQGSCAGFLVQHLTPFLQCSESMEWREAAGGRTTGGPTPKKPQVPAPGEVDSGCSWKSPS